jgi:outer membrane protein assembly factor BamB
MTLLFLTSLLLLFQAAAPPAEELFDAARSGNRERVAQLLDAGVDVNAKARYDATALMFASDRGHLDIVRLLVERGADVNVADTFYKFTALGMALGSGHRDVAKYLLQHGAKGGAGALNTGIREGDEELVKLALAAPDLDAPTLHAALARAKRGSNAAITAMIGAAAAARPIAATATVTVPAAVLQSYAGTYRSDATGVSMTISATENGLTLMGAGQQAVQLTPTSDTMFVAPELANFSVMFSGRGGTIENMTVSQGGTSMAFARDASPAAAATDAAPITEKSSPTDTGAAPAEAAPMRAKGAPWPAFRGANASGVADGQGAVADWDVATGRNIRWKTPIPGIAVSSPIVWGDRVFLTTAIGTEADKTFRTGLYGDVKPIDDLTTHTWRVYAVDRRNGAVLWQKDVFTGEPKVKRHPKSSQANSTPVTNGTHVVAVFGSIGMLACLDVNGKQLWQRDIGVIDNGWFFDPTYQWGHSSSPIIYRSSVIVQVDQQKGSYLASYDLDTGKPIWKTERPEEISTWGTPTLVTGPRGDELVTNGTKVRAYDPATGKQLWTLGPNSEITVGTPVAGKDVVYVTGGYPPVRPVYAVKAGASGDISLAKGQTSGGAIAWSNDREGTYIPTPLLYRDILYTLNSNGIVTAYNATSGERLYRARVGGGGAFAASPVAADGRLYFANEDGDVFVVTAGPEYVELGKRSMNEVIMATPAISDGVILIRTLGNLYAVGEPAAADRPKTLR